MNKKLTIHIFVGTSLAGFVAVCLSASAAEDTIKQQIDAIPGGKLVMDVDFGAVDVSPGADGQVAVGAHRTVDFGNESKEKEYLAAAPVTISKDGDAIIVRGHSSNRQTFWSFPHSHMDAQYTIHVPRNFDVDLHTSGGSIGATDLMGNVKARSGGGRLSFARLQGTLIAGTSGGSVELNNCDGPIEVESSGGDIKTENGKGSLLAHTSGGSIQVRDFVGDTQVRTSGGDLMLDRITGGIKGKTSGGSIRAAVAGPTVNDIKLETSAGSITVGLPASAAVEIVADTSAGRVKSDLPLVIESADHEHLRARLNGGGKSVVLRTSAGSIIIRANSPETAGR